MEYAAWINPTVTMVAMVEPTIYATNVKAVPERRANCCGSCAEKTQDLRRIIAVLSAAETGKKCRATA